jgi:hypothetical protein
MSHPCRVLWGGLTPYPGLEPWAGMYRPCRAGKVRPANALPLTRGRAGLRTDCGRSRLWAIGCGLWAVGLVCGCASVDAGVFVWERTHSIADALPSGPARSDRNGCASADP